MIEELENKDKAEVFNTACPRNCYSTCSFKVWVEHGKVKNIEAQSLNKSTQEGSCLKGLSYVERVNSNDSILYPLQKINNEFIKISWDKAIEIIADKLAFFRTNFGISSVLYYAASGMSGLLNGVSSNFWKLYGGTTTVYGNLYWPLRKHKEMSPSL